MENLFDYINNYLITEGIFDPEAIKSDPINIHPKNTTQLKKVIIQYVTSLNPSDDDVIDLNWIDVSKIKSMKSLFHDKALCDKNYDISEWNVSNVTDMNGMFWNCPNFNCDISEWNVSNVTNMDWMFTGCSSFDQDLNKWDVSNVQYMDSIFNKCSSFDPSKQIKNWKPQNLRKRLYDRHPEDMQKFFNKTAGNEYPTWFVNFYNACLKMRYGQKYNEDSVVKFEC